MDAVTNVPFPGNEPIKGYAPGSPERAALEAEDQGTGGERAELTMTIGGQQRQGGGELVDVVQPHNHRHVLGELRNATDADVAAAIEAARQAAPGWRALSFDDRAAIFLKAADLLAGPWRQTINAATILGQSKSVYQAEIDAACELIDFWRYNVHYARRLLAEQPAQRARHLEPARVPAARGVRAGHHAVQLHLDRGQPADGAGPDGQRGDLEAVAHPAAVRALPDAAARGRGPAAGRDQHGHRRRRRRSPAVALPHPDLAGIHFTGSTGTFQHLWRTVGENIAGYRGYPRLVGETGGKDFVIAHPSADPDVLIDRAGPRRVRVSGPEVLGRVAQLRRRAASGTR